MTAARPAAPDDGRLPRRIAFLGLGLIGGSIARALRAGTGRAELVAWTPAGAGPRAALAQGVLDAAPDTLPEAVAGAGLVILAGPPLAILELLDHEAGALHGAVERGATLTDVASTKAAIVDAADAAGLPFVGGHPMAGRETSGFAAAEADLFTGRPWVIVPGAAARAIDVERVDRLARAVGARPLVLDRAAHDAAVAAVSHLSLVAAVALVEAVTSTADWPIARDLAASGWAGTTRLARGDPEMGAGILATNRAAVAARLRAYRAAIDRWIAALDGEDRREAGELRARLAAARAALEAETDG